MFAGDRSGEWICGDGYRAVSLRMRERLATAAASKDYWYFADAGTISYFLDSGQDCMNETVVAHIETYLKPELRLIRYLLVLPHRAGRYGALPTFPFLPLCLYSQAECHPKNLAKPGAAL